MKTFRSSYLLALGLLTAGSAFGATGTGTARAEIVRSIAVSNPIHLQFGTIAAGSTGGTVTMALTGVRSSTGGVTLTNHVRGEVALFLINGSPHHTYSVGLPAAIDINSGASGHTMRVDAFTKFSGLGHVFDVNGLSSMIVGATLHVGANQATGQYSGEYLVFIDYD